MDTGSLMAIAGVAGIGAYWYLGLLARRKEKAVNRLKLPQGWDLAKDVVLEMGGKVDLVITAPDGKTFVVLVRPQKHVRYKARLFSDGLEFPDERRLTPCPLVEALSAADAHQATPVVWLPYAQASRAKTSKKGVLVVHGREKQLLKGVGARRSWF